MLFMLLFDRLPHYLVINNLLIIQLQVIDGSRLYSLSLTNDTE
jgi:hypothetical protein